MHATGGVCNSRRRPNSPLISFRWLRFVAGRRTKWGFGPLRSSSPCRPSRLTEARHALAPSPGSAIGLAPHGAAAATTCTSTVSSDFLRVNNRRGEACSRPKTVDISEDACGPLRDAWAHGSRLHRTLLCAQLAAGSDWTAPFTGGNTAST
jgi:hypothetical protein